MIPDNLSQLPKFRKFMLELAVFGAFLTIVGLVLKLAGVPFNFSLFIVGIGTLAVVAFFLDKIFPYRSSDNSLRLAPIWNFAMRLSGYTLAVLLMGLLFVMFHWPGGKMLLIVGLVAVVGCGLAWLFYLMQRNKQ